MNGRGRPFYYAPQIANQSKSIGGGFGETALPRTNPLRGWREARKR